MSPKKIEVSKISCLRDTELEKTSAGFQVSGYKEFESTNEPEKVGFILSGVKLISFQQIIVKGIRLRIKWIPNGFEIREELNQLDEALRGLTRQNNIIFVSKDDNTPVIMQGEPQVGKNEFVGHLIRINWEFNEIQIFPLQKSCVFQCVLNSRNHRIDCFIK